MLARVAVERWGIVWEEVGEEGAEEIFLVFLFFYLIFVFEVWGRGWSFIYGGGIVATGEGAVGGN
jgi:hypothetical protein